jgi:AcrR family transcriptional regulator
MLPSDNLIASANIQPAQLVHHPIGVALGPSLRERLTQAACPLFAHRGIKDVTLEEIKRAAGLAAEELASVYSCRDEAAADFLARRSRDWTIGTVEAGARKRGTTPEERLLAIFDVFDDWFHRDDFEACSFTNVLLEMGAAHPLGKASIEYLVHIRQIVATLAEEADLREPAEFAHSWHILMKGAIISASEGDVHAAKRSKKMARALIGEHRNPCSAVAERTPGGISAPAAGSTGEYGTLENRTDEGCWTDWDDLFPTRTTVGSLSVVDAKATEFAFDHDRDAH